MPLQRLWAPLLAVLFLTCAAAQSASAGGYGPGQTGQNNPQTQAPPPPDGQADSGQEAPPFDPSIFENPLPADQLSFLTSLAGMPSGKAIKDKQLKKVMHSVVPGCEFHYGRDIPLWDALEMVLEHSPAPVVIRDGRYVTLSGTSGPYLAGRGFLWIDMKTGIGLGGFYFHPTNGEPTPTVAVFSKQVRTKDKVIEMSQLPPEFALDLYQWQWAYRIPPVTTRYFLTGSDRRILLEHNEEYCSLTEARPGMAAPPPPGICEQMDANAADVDLDAAGYLEQVHYMTNATAWMLTGPDEVAWLQVRNTACIAGPNPVRCRIRMTRARTRVILSGHPARG
ncbi:hypothetical protein [Paracidobacterium acidisoli]|uniref:Uncharacterized protein n=1 Tax=Paracidobacterium acidisoli TaxID=2303751 RepID=A0A372IUJ2_9BACT|nr:hypothetical protein [Paracidobacterium acidisoli]MBT9330052.1 hypothetical protein [Paracidobacterium acidisoli]